VTPHRQTILADPTRGDGHDASGVAGDCWRTAIACLTDEQPSSVPHFVEEGEEGWWDATQAWVKARGDDLIYLPLPIPEDWLPWWHQQREVVEHILLGGPSPRGKFGHVVVGTPDLETVHDPHPSGAGILSVDEVYVYVKGGLS
jgi:hypothetical protein